MLSKIRSQFGARLRQSSRNILTWSLYDLNSYPTTKLSVLSNQLTVASQPVPSETATVGVFVNAGTRHEDNAALGSANLVARLASKGTSTHNNAQIQRAIENIGGVYNVQTTRDRTVYTLSVPKGHVSEAVSILGDIVANASYQADVLESEKTSVLKEIEASENNAEQATSDYLHATAYQKSALARSVLGSENSVSGMSRDALLSFKARHYTADRMAVVGAGAVTHDQLVAASEKILSKIPTEAPADSATYQTPAIFTGSDLRVRYDSMPTAYFSLAFPTAGAADPDTVSLMVARELLGSWAYPDSPNHSSQLVLDLVNNEDGVLAQKVHTFHDVYSDTGLFGVYAESTSQYSAFMTAFAVTNAFRRLTLNVSPVKLAEAKTHLRNKVLGDLDNPSKVALSVGNDLLSYGRRIHPAELIARVNAVDGGAVKLAARRYFYDTDFALSAVGNIWELPDYNWFRAKTSNLRV